MKYLIILSFLISSTGFAQSYNELITKHREEYKADFIKDNNSPLRKSDIKHLNFYNADSNYRVVAEVMLLENQKIFKMPTYAGTTADYIRYANLKFLLNGKPVQLTVYKNIALSANPAYKEYLFLPFTDQTNNKETYGGGRYIDLKSSAIANGKIEFDFNKAYNPYCAYSDGYRCPIPPEENDLAISILAGEKLFTGEKKHK
ncbi:DUF1684 domain-containing protein [Pedobacter frigiditerrae]|uniref:DUF1684 domain-containing protein n=1 Tax=Pedobacter frigiditerrae TaxID=2530452 RepID=A0A4R0MRC4_9SPHI|nr:DUF1684 domain-containing protein [Pedobacter frigiditerrae]TCC89263.1 DUF1684 domain-containing protein [Pedobacter frigiditerrae]